MKRHFVFTCGINVFKSGNAALSSLLSFLYVFPLLLYVPYYHTIMQFSQPKQED